jgi:hypothetical protein
MAQGVSDVAQNHGADDFPTLVGSKGQGLELVVREAD